MATSNYYSKEDDQSGATGGGGGGVVGGGGGGGMGTSAAPSGGGGGGTGFVNLQSYLDANQGGSSQVADTLAGDVSSQVAGSNQGLADTVSQGMASAQGIDTSGLAVGGSGLGHQFEEDEAVGGISYGMSGDTKTALAGHERGQQNIRDYGQALQDDSASRKESIQRLYGSGRGSGFGGLDSFLVAADKGAGLGGKVESAIGGLDDVGAGRDQIAGAYKSAEDAKVQNTRGNYQAARDQAAEAERQAAIQVAKDLENYLATNNTMPGIAGGLPTPGYQPPPEAAPPPMETVNIESSSGIPTGALQIDPQPQAPNQAPAVNINKQGSRDDAVGFWDSFLGGK